MIPIFRSQMVHRRTAVKILLVWLALVAPAPFLNAVWGKNRSELDIVVTTNLQTGKEHTTAYLDRLRQEAVTAFHGLNPRSYGSRKRKGDGDEPEEPQDGAARFRLVVEHKGTVVAADTPTVKSGHPVVKFEMNGTVSKTTYDISKYITTWSINAQQKGTLHFRLMKWEDNKYRVLDTWTKPVTDALMGGGTASASDVQRATDGPQKGVGPCPVKTSELRQQAIMNVMPGPFRSGITSRLVTVKFVRAVKATGQKVPPVRSGLGFETATEIEVQVQNNSPWPVKHVQMLVVAPTMTYHCKLDFAEPLAPEKATKTTTVGTPFVGLHSLATGSVIVEFAPKE